MKILNQFLLFSLICMICNLFSGCAHITPLNGGIKDVDPPKVVKIVPKQKETNVVGKNIEIEFDEYIVLKDVPNQVSVIPMLAETPEITSKGKKLNVILKGSLDPNTTYTIRFGNAIMDLHDGNVLEGFEYCFSTGSTIDSFYVRGKVIDAFSKSPARDTWVYLYKELNDSVVFKEKPYYYSKCDENGGYLISNIKQGAYKIVALNDKNKNFTYEQGDESIGFINESATISKDSNNYDLLIFKEEVARAFVKKVTQPISGKALIILSRNLTQPQLIPLYSKTTLGADRTMSFESNDTLIVWYKNITDDTLKYILKDKDNVIDTISIFCGDSKRIEKEVTAGKKKVVIEKVSNLFPTNNLLQLCFNIPVTIIDTSKIKLIQSKNKEVGLLFAGSILPTSNQNLRSESGFASLFTSMVAFEFESNYELILLPGAVKNYFEVSNDTLKISFNTASKESYGRLVMTLSMDNIDSSAYLFQLLDSKMKIAFESEVIFLNNEAVLNIPYLMGDNYSSRLIIDNNHDHQYSSGNYIDHILPEIIIEGAQQIKILSDWDTENKWKITR